MDSLSLILNAARSHASELRIQAARAPEGIEANLLRAQATAIMDAAREVSRNA